MSSTPKTGKEGTREELETSIRELQARVCQIQPEEWERLRLSICFTDAHGKMQWRTFSRIVAITTSDDMRHITIEGSDESGKPLVFQGSNIKRIAFEELPK